MKKVDEKELCNITGGDSGYVSGPIINAVVAVIKVLQEAGYNFGSGMRRIVEGEMCPLK